jgi:hypothetical protein
MTDEERERHIADCTRLMENAYAAYIAWGCDHDLMESRKWLAIRDQAVRDCSAAQVQSMELAMGIA